MSPVGGAAATLTIDLSALAGNYRLLRGHLKKGCECGAVVKANAYGLGIAPISERLAQEGCRHFFVASLDEALAVRQALPERSTPCEIFILLGAEADTVGGMAEFGFIPVLNSRHQLERWRGEAHRQERRLPAILHIDTGMNRLGLELAEVDLLAEESKLAGIELRAIMSHLACADDPEAPLNRQQLEAFNVTRSRFSAAHATLANSAGVLLGKSYHFDLVRPGIALYGGNPLAQGPNIFSEVIQLQTRIVQVREIDTPEAVGYGSTHRVTGPSRIATVPVGYADGYLRSLSNRGSGIVAGIRVPLAGRVSMDLMTLDVSAVPPEHAHVGAVVNLIGGGIGLDEAAHEAGTISYEILTRLGSRLKRVYVN